MQQVSRQQFTLNSAAVDPRHLPVPLRSGRTRPLVGLSHYWVLHSGRVVRLVLLAMVCAALAAGYVLREDIGVAMGEAGIWVSARLVDAGFGVTRISMTGQSLTSEAQVLQALDIDAATSIFTLGAFEAQARLEAMPSVDTATVRKVYPNEIVVTVEEPEVVARWRMDGVTNVIDSMGEPIAPAVGDDAELPLVIGMGAGDDALPMINLINRYPALQTDLAALARIGDRRWDLIYYTGLRVQLPETGIAAALARLDTYQRDHQLLERDVSLIDLRLPEAVAVMPVNREPVEENDAL